MNKIHPVDFLCRNIFFKRPVFFQSLGRMVGGGEGWLAAPVDGSMASAEICLRLGCHEFRIMLTQASLRRMHLLLMATPEI